MHWLHGPPQDPLWTLVLILALAGMAMVAYAVRALDVAGSLASFVLGLFVALRGGLGWLLLMAAFTMVGVIVTRIGRRRKKERMALEERDGERGIRNVLANGAAGALAAAALFLSPAWLPPLAPALAFATAIAAVTADTMASELGTLASRARRILPPFPAMQPGENGGVSWPGQAAAATGAILIAWLSAPLVGIPSHLIWVPALAGFAGCQLDSLLGATLERDAVRDGPLSKQDVNFLASAVPALLVLVATWLFA